MKTYRVLFLTWGIAGLGAVLGSILGGGAGDRGLYVGAWVGGLLATIAVVLVMNALGWIPRGERSGAAIGGLIGFALAAPIAVMNLDTPVIPVAVCGLVGIGVLLGAGLARGWQRG